MKKKIIICVYIVMLLIASRLLFTYVYNEYVISKYNDGDYDINMKPAMMCNWIQPYIAHYNAGNIHYKNGDYRAAIDEYNLAMAKEPADEHICHTRINMALAIIKMIPEDYSSEENIDKTVELLTNARDILIKNDCAKDKEAGHSKEATKLREEIDAILKSLQQQGGSGDGKDGEEDDPSSKPSEPEKQDAREQQIKEKVKDNQNQAIQDRYKDKLFYEELEKEYGNYFEEPVW